MLISTFAVIDYILNIEQCLLPLRDRPFMTLHDTRLITFELLISINAVISISINAEYSWSSRSKNL